MRLSVVATFWYLCVGFKDERVFIDGNCDYFASCGEKPATSLQKAAEAAGKRVADDCEKYRIGTIFSSTFDSEYTQAFLPGKVLQGIWEECRKTGKPKKISASSLIRGTSWVGRQHDWFNVRLPASTDSEASDTKKYTTHTLDSQEKNVEIHQCDYPVDSIVKSAAGKFKATSKVGTVDIFVPPESETGSCQKAIQNNLIVKFLGGLSEKVNADEEHACITQQIAGKPGACHKPFLRVITTEFVKAAGCKDPDKCTIDGHTQLAAAWEARWAGLGRSVSVELAFVTGMDDKQPLHALPVGPEPTADAVMQSATTPYDVTWPRRFQFSVIAVDPRLASRVDKDAAIRIGKIRGESKLTVLLDLPEAIFHRDNAGKLATPKIFDAVKKRVPHITRPQQIYVITLWTAAEEEKNSVKVAPKPPQAEQMTNLVQTLLRVNFAEPVAVPVTPDARGQPVIAGAPRQLFFGNDVLTPISLQYRVGTLFKKEWQRRESYAKGLLPSQVDMKKYTPPKSCDILILTAKSWVDFLKRNMGIKEVSNFKFRLSNGEIVDTKIRLEVHTEKGAPAEWVDTNKCSILISSSPKDFSVENAEKKRRFFLDFSMGAPVDISKIYKEATTLAPNVDRQVVAFEAFLQHVIMQDNFLRVKLKGGDDKWRLPTNMQRKTLFQPIPKQYIPLIRRSAIAGFDVPALTSGGLLTFLSWSSRVLGDAGALGKIDELPAGHVAANEYKDIHIPADYPKFDKSWKGGLQFPPNSKFGVFAEKENTVDIYPYTVATTRVPFFVRQMRSSMSLLVNEETANFLSFANPNLESRFKDSAHPRTFMG